MKIFLKKLLSERIIFILKKWKIKYFPSQYELLFKENQKNLFETRIKFYSIFIKKGDLCYDVGANIGNRVDAFLHLGAEVIAVEPQKSCYTILEMKYGNKIKIVKKGLGAEVGTLDFHISDSTVLSSFSTDWINSVKSERFKNNKWKTILKTEITTLDNLILEFGVPAFIKIDVEGYELEVLKGLSKPIGLISFEYTVPEQTDKVIECIMQLESIENEIECNYCSGETMILELNHWIKASEMKKYISNDKFVKSGFGDIYIKCKQMPSSLGL